MDIFSTYLTIFCGLDAHKLTGLIPLRHFLDVLDHFFGGLDACKLTGLILLGHFLDILNYFLVGFMFIFQLTSDLHSSLV